MVPDKELDEAIQAFAGGNTPGTRNVHALLLELKGRRAVIAPGLAEAGYGIVASSKPRCDGEMRDGDADV